MTVINFNIENKNNDQMKKEILQKMKKVNQSFVNDQNYDNLFYDIVSNATNKKNLKLVIDKVGGYKIQGLHNNQSGGEGDETLADLINKETDINKKNLLIELQKIKLKKNPEYENNTEDIIIYKLVTGEDITNGNNKEGLEFIKNLKKYINIEPGTEHVIHAIEPETGTGETETGETETGETETGETETGETETGESGTGETVGTGTGTGTGTESFFSKFNLFSGGSKSDSDSESDGVFSSDDESVDFTRYQTNIFNVNDDDELMQHIKNMRSKKYLNSLVKDELLQIAKNNQLKVSKKNNYLSKVELVKSIKKFYS